MNSKAQLPSFTKVSDRVFKVHKGDIYIGREKVDEQLFSVLREQAQYISTSQFYEVFRSTIVNEAYDLALAQSINFDQVQFAKALAHWQTVMDTIIVKLLTKQ